MSLLIALMMTPSLAGMQAAQPYEAPAAAPLLPAYADLPIVAGATAAPDCGGVAGVAEAADCVTAPLMQIGAVAEAYVPLLTGAGWVSTGGRENQFTFERPRADGQCDGLALSAFYDTTLAPEALAAAPGYLAFANLGQGACRAGLAPTLAPQPTPPQP